MERLRKGMKPELIAKEPLHSNPLEADFQLMHQQLLALAEQRKSLNL